MYTVGVHRGGCVMAYVILIGSLLLILLPMRKREKQG